MKYPSKAYSDLVERKQNEIRGNVSSVKMTPQECEAEIKSVTGEAVSSFAQSPEEYMKNVKFVETPVKKRRGRPPGSKNKSKT